MDLSLYLDEEYIIDLAAIFIGATDNPNAINDFISEILEIKGEEHALYPDIQLSRIDYITVICSIQSIEHNTRTISYLQHRYMPNKSI